MRNTVFVFTCIFIIVVLMQLANSCNNTYDIKTTQYMTNGEKVYRAHCQNCHGKDGEGLGKLYPPLTDPNYLKDNRDLLPRIIRYGLKDTIQVANELFAGVMPANPQLTDVDIAYVLTYITLRFGDSEVKFDIEEVKKALSTKPN